MKIMQNSNFHSVCNITNMPDEILIEIILYLKASARVALGNSCKRFHRLVFEERTLLRDLDFSEEGYLISALDIDRYFCNENTSQHILKLNLRNFDIIGYDHMLCQHVSKAINLIDINLHGIHITKPWILVELLKALPFVKRLSFDWPDVELVGNDIFYSELQEQFSKLTYLSVALRHTSCHFSTIYPTIHLSQELKELHVTAYYWPKGELNYMDIDSKLKSLEIVEYYGPSVRMLAEYFVSILPHPEEWTYFQLFNPETNMDGFYLERNVQVCDELLESKVLKRLSYNYPRFASSFGGFVISASLLEEVMTINQGNLPKKLCCFSSAINEYEGQLSLPSVFQISKLWILKIDEAKWLLKDPQYQISYLCISHNIEQECDAHVVVSAFPSLTELVLSNVIKHKRKTLDQPIPFDKQRERNLAPDDSNNLPNLDSCFSRLAESTPHLRCLAVIASTSVLESDEMWDLPALHSIAHWKLLTTLRLSHVPIVDGQFLIEIGKQCEHLENLDLRNLGPSHMCCYMSELSEMLICCSHLTDFTLCQSNIGRLSEAFFGLAANPQLRRVRIESNRVYETVIDFTPSIEQLIRRCSKLTSFVCVIGMFQAESNKLKSTLQRVTSELSRQTFLDIS